MMLRSLAILKLMKKFYHFDEIKIKTFPYGLVVMIVELGALGVFNLHKLESYFQVNLTIIL